MTERLMVNAYRKQTPCESCGHYYGEFVRYIFASAQPPFAFAAASVTGYSSSISRAL